MSKVRRFPGKGDTINGPGKARRQLSRRKAVIVVSDLHCGSLFGLLPDNFVNAADAPVPQNPGQRYLWECWLHFCYRAAAIAPDIVAIVVNGDVVDGSQRAQAATELCLPLISDQVRAAQTCLETLKTYVAGGRQPLSETVPLFLVQGTEYHEGKAGRDIEAVAQALGARPYEAVGTGVYSREVLDLIVDGVRLNFAHHVSVSTGFYKATAIDREGAFASLATRDKIDAIIRSHVHNFVGTIYSGRVNLTTPCWQLQTRFMRKHSVHRMLPTIGGVILWADGEKKARGERAVEVEDVTYKLPPVKVTTVSL